MFSSGPVGLPAGLEPLAGGHSGETFLARVGDEATVVRLHTGGRGPEAPEVDAALLRLVRGLVPVPTVLEVRRGRDDGTPGLLVTTFEPGERGDLLLARLDDAGLARAGDALGRVVADLAGMPMSRAGLFADGDLTIRPFDTGGLEAWVDQHEAALAHWTADERAGLREVAAHGQALLDTVDRTCLVHSDLNPKNVLLDPHDQRVTAVLDWEFAHAGHPATDLGNLLRFDRHPAFAEAVLARWTARHGGTAQDALYRARAADLLALVHLAARRGENPVADRAEALLRAIAGSRALHAVPA